MADNQFKNSNDEFEDIFSNKNKSNQYEDIFSSSGNSDDFEDISSDSNDFQDDFSKEVEQAFQVRYNSAVENRRRQEIQYDNINDVYGDLANPLSYLYALPALVFAILASVVMSKRQKKKEISQEVK